MNAYELADELDKMLKSIGLEDNRVPTMLRQQAEKISNMEIWEKKYLDRIEELEKEKIRAYDNGFEDGQKANTPPKTYVFDGKQVWDTAPQIKELSDEEIIEIRDSCYVQSGIDEWEFDDVVFARAILKKASEK
jgi:hypothetical protein